MSDRLDAGYSFGVIRSHSGVGTEDMTPRETFGAILVGYNVTIAYGPGLATDFARGRHSAGHRAFLPAGLSVQPANTNPQCSFPRPI
jgi:hypothetical protein